VPEVSAKLREPETKERKFEEVVKSAEQAAVLVVVYEAVSDYVRSELTDSLAYPFLCQSFP